MAKRKDKTKITEVQGGGGGWFRWFKPKPFKGASGKHPKTERGKLTESQHRRQQEQIEAIKSKHGGGSTGGRTGGRTGIVNKSESLKGQKVVKQKKKKVDDLDPKEHRKHETLRKKRADQEALNQKEMERLYGKKKEGGWKYPKGYDSKAAIKKRIEPTKTLSLWKGNTPKARKRMEDWKPPPIEGIPRPRKK